MNFYKGGKLYFFAGLSNDECLFISNIFSWSKSKSFKEAVYKTDEEMAKEINCGYWHIRKIKKKLKDLGHVIN